MRETRRGRERYDVTFDKRNKVRASQRVVVCMVALNASVTRAVTRFNTAQDCDPRYQSQRPPPGQRDEGQEAKGADSGRAAL